MSGVVLAFALSSLALASGQGEDGAPAELSCVEGGAANRVSADDVHRIFARRAVEVVRAAIASDRGALARLVSPGARFALWRGDAGSGGREPVGVEGALEFVRHMNAAQFEFSISYAGPLSTDPCGIQNAEVLFSSAAADRAYMIDFRFERGLLVEVEGREGEVTRGNLNDSGPPRG